MASDDYTADSAIPLPSFPMLCVQSDAAGGCAFVPGVRPLADGMSVSTTIPSFIG